MSPVDRDLVGHDAELAERVSALSDLSVRLAFIDADAGVDKYHVLQGLRDGTLGDDPKCCYVYQRSGGTGTRGRIDLDGPMEQTKAAKAVAEVFQEMTGHAWGTVAPGHRALPGKYWLQQAAIPDDSATWQYYVDDGVDGKQPGWYPYEKTACVEVEELYAQHVANDREARTATRHVQSGYFSYTVDLEAMTQQNARTQKVRTIRRASCEEEAQEGAGPGRAAGRKAGPGRAAAAKALKAPRAAPAEGAGVKMVARKTAAAAKRKAAMKIKAAKKAMKRKAMKKKAMKKMTKPKKHQVFKGSRAKTSGGLSKKDLTRNKKGRVVSLKQSVHGKRIYEDNHIVDWVAACKAARTELGLTGFVLMKKGTPVYDLARARYDAMRAASA